MINHSIRPVSVLVADDHRLMREGTAALLATDPRVTVVALASDGREAVELAIRLRPRVVLLDINMPGMGGIEACAILSAELPGTQVLMLTVSEQDGDLYAAFRLGAAGYLLKDMPPRELVESIIAVSRGERRIAPGVAARLLSEMVQPPPASSSEAPGPGRSRRKPAEPVLSARETEVLRLLARGLPNREIANDLFISEPTVKTHVRHILDKLQLRNRSEAAAYVARRER